LGHPAQRGQAGFAHQPHLTEFYPHLTEAYQTETIS